MKFSSLSFKKQFYSTLFSIGMVVITAGFSFNIYSSYTYKKDAFIEESMLQVGLIADNSVASLMFFDNEGVQASLSQLHRYKNILQVIIYDNNKEVFARYNPNNRDSLKQENTELPIFSLDKDTLVFKYEILDNGVKYGTIYLEKSTKILRDFLYDSAFKTMIFSLLLILVMIFVVVKMSKIFITPIVKLSNTITKLSESQNYDTRLYYDGDSKSDNEIGKLYDAFNDLFVSIGIHQKSRDQALKKAESYQHHLEKLTDELEHRVEDRTLELQESIDTLKKAQNQLVESEKMAALGSLVSGVAHEVNTPLGNAVTGSSIIKGECNTLLKMMEDGTLKKSVLNDKLMHIQEASRLLLKSITSAADLIKSFKKISVDQSLESKREFDVVEYINEIFLTFGNKLKQIPVNVEIISNDSCILNSYPGAFAQIFNNFIQNSIMHGFEKKVDGAKISVEIYTKDKELYIIYSDNGSGVDKNIHSKVFEPFVTTKRNAGGTGLGLNIVYNLITQKLQGRLLFDSEKDKGTKFTIIIPVENIIK